ncbi:DNA-directed DNA polymerase II small subunit [Candidatus Bathyarchaeota archaeon]|nr:MAG: DNA-directed DNA polymerase II small subunit [Candidatus Bathyarchaeota archaeon]
MGEFNSEDWLRKTVEKILEAGYQVEAEAFNFLKSTSKLVDVEDFTQGILKKLAETSPPSIFVDKKIVEEVFNQLRSKNKVDTSKQESLEKIGELEVGKGVFRPYAKEVEAKIEVLKDPSKYIASDGTMESFSRYFRDRFKRLLKILGERLDVKGYTGIGSVLKERNGARVKIVGMVSEKISRGRRIIFRVEDLESSITVLVQSTKPDLIEKAREVLLDQIVCITGFKSTNNLVVAEEIIMPDIPQHKSNHAEEDVNVVLTSDFHVGSKVFEEKLVKLFLKWLKGEIGNEKERGIAGKVKYIIVAGDLVDGVGLYPQQENELEIKDVYKQYEVAAKIFEQVPDYIKVIIIPGNHDATRKTLPQPAIPKKFAEPIYHIPNLILLGNPAQVKLHGVNILIHHGRSLEDVLASLPNVNHQNVTIAMAHLLKVRHLAPIYGQKTPLAPEPKDWMVIESVPDIYHTGHIHVFNHTMYKGVRLINSGCWQRQTSYQKKMGINPVFGVVPIVNLQKMSLTIMDFTKIF